MKKILFVLVIFLATASIPFMPLTAKGEIVWKMASKMLPSSPEGIVFKFFADEVGRLSNGKMKLNVYPSEQLGGTRASMDMLRKGTIHVYAESLSFFHKFVPDVSLSTLPFVFRDRDHWQRFMNSSMAKQWKKELIQKIGVSYLGNYGETLRGPYRVLVCKKPVLTLEDVKGLKLRMYSNDMVINVWKALGANVIQLAWTENYQGLKTGLIEAVTATFGQVEPMKFQEVAKYVMRTDEFPQSTAFFINHKKYEGLPQDLKKALNEAQKRAGKLSFKVIPEVAEKAIDLMFNKEKVTFIRAPMDSFRQKLNPLYKRWESEEKFGLKKGIIDYIERL